MDRALLADRLEEALERYDKDRWERFVDANDPGELIADLRIADSDIAAGKWRLEWIFLLGDELFEHDFIVPEGFGPGQNRVHDGPKGGPDALSCNECHHRGGFDGAGDLSQNAFFDGDGYAPESGFERNAPHVLGLGVVQKIAEEMTITLHAQRDTATFSAKVSGQAQKIKLEAKGISFGTLVASPDGTVDSTGVAGIQTDLIVRPFGWKGAHATIRTFAMDGFQRHHGMQAPDTDLTLPGSGPAWDKDADNNTSEITPGMLTAITTYLSLLEIPVMIPPKSPELLERHSRGWELFNRIGCENCHRQSLPIAEGRLAISDTLAVDLFVDGEAPRPRRDVFLGYGTPIYLFSDLKLHDMGEELAESRENVSGVPASVFLTRSLWGLAETGPYLHDGRATTVDEAILAHGGEAKAARDYFEKLPADSKADIRIFLVSLTRYPRIEFR